MVANYDDTNGDRFGGLRLVHTADTAGDGGPSHRVARATGHRSPWSITRRLVVVADLEVLRQSLTITLSDRLGMEAEKSSGRSAEPHLHAPEGRGLSMVVDLAKRDGDGTRRVSALRRANRRADILVLVARYAHNRACLLEAGADEVLGKDATVDEIVQTVKRMAVNEL